MAKKQTIKIDPEAAREKEVKEIAKKDQGEKVKKWYFLCSGNGLTVTIPDTVRLFQKTNADGTSQQVRRPAKRLDFDHGWAETNDSEIVKKVQNHPMWKRDFYFHPNSVPEGGDLEAAKRFSTESKNMIAEMKEREEKAKHFDKDAHPEKGVVNPVDPETGEPDPSGNW